MFKHVGMPSTSKGQATRLRLLRAAEWEFSRKGFHDASVWSIGVRAEVGIGTFYLYFRDKKDALRGVLASIGDRVQRLLTAAGAAAEHGSEGERSRVLAYLDYMENNPGAFRIVHESVFLDTWAFRRYQRQVSGHKAKTRLHVRDGIGLTIDHKVLFLRQHFAWSQGSVGTNGASGDEPWRRRQGT